MKKDRLISSYIDNELSPEEQARLDAELQAMPELQRDVEEWKGYGDMLRDAAAGQSEDPERAWIEVRRSIRNLKPAKAPVTGLLFPRFVWAGAAAVLVTALTLYFMFRPVGDTSPVASDGGTEVEWVESDLPGAVSMVYADDETGLTVIWVVVDEGENGHAG